MLKMSVKKNDASSPREGTASAVREAARSGVPERATSPERPKRRAFTAEYKLRIVREADAAVASGVEGAVGELLRKEGLYSSHLTSWRRERDAGELAGLTPRKRVASRARTARRRGRASRARVRTVGHELYKANAVISVQKLTLLGETCRADGEDFAQAPLASGRAGWM
jgi:transposase-like protein